MKTIAITTTGFVFLLLAVSSSAYHSDIDRILLQGKSRYQGFISGLLDDQNFKVSKQCFSSELATKFEQVFDSAVNIFIERDISQALKLYQSTSNAIKYFDNTCNLRILFEQFYQLCVYRKVCNLRTIVTNLKDQVHYVMEHLGKHAYASYQIENTWDEDLYFQLVRDKYSHIGSLIGIALGEKYDHTLQKEEEQESYSSSSFKNLMRSNKVEPDEVKQDYLILKHFIQGIVQGLSEKGNEKKKCYKNLSYMKNDFNTAIDILVKTLEGENNITVISLAATQTYGHLKGIYRDCRLVDLGSKLIRFREITGNLMDNKEELNAILVNFGMAALRRDFIRAGQLIGNLLKISLDFHVY